MEQGIELLFQHVTTVKALASIREAIHELLSQVYIPDDANNGSMVAPA